MSNNSGEVNRSAVMSASGEIVPHAGSKTPNSYKYPLLRRYFEFGPWVGRNRKALCLACHSQSSSSQPDRLVKHLKRCSALSEAEKSEVTELMNDKTANKRKKPLALKLKRSYDDDNKSKDDSHMGQVSHLHNSGHSIPPDSAEKSRREYTDRDSEISEALTRFIMVCRIPLKAVHSKEFVELVHALNPDYPIPSKERITNVLIPGLLNII